MPEVEGDELVDVVICDFALIDFREFLSSYHLDDIVSRECHTDG